MSKSVELSVNTNPLWTEYVSDILINKIGCSGVVSDEKLYNDEVLVKDNTGIVKGYLPVIEEKPLKIAEVQAILRQEKENLIKSGIQEENIGCWSVTSQEISDDEWAHSWKQYWHPQKISEKIVICPSWETYTAQNDEIIINLDPGSAFGTGTHPTTRLCVQALEKIIAKEANTINIADVGTGSGILAVAAIKLGADYVVGVDNDASAIPVAVENAQKNGIEDKCKFYTGVAADIKGEYDIVVANILADVIIENMPALAKLVKTDGILILSGIISAKSQAVQNSAENHSLNIKTVLQEENWVAIIAQK